MDATSVGGKRRVAWRNAGMVIILISMLFPLY